MGFFCLLLACVTGLYYTSEGYFGHSFESPKKQVVVGSSHWWRCHAHCGCEVSGAGLGGELDFLPGRSQHLPPPQIPTQLLPLVVAAEARGEREGSVSRAVHVMGRAGSHLCSFHCGHIQLWNIFAFCFHVPACACPALFHLRNSHSARVRGQSFSVHCSSSARTPLVPQIAFIVCASLFLKPTF